jgi:hypothetical protein
VYRSAAPDFAWVQAYEAFLGRGVDYVLAFMPDRPSWDQFGQAVLQSFTNGPPGATPATAWAPLLGPRRLVLGVPACVQGTTWAGEASGVNDAHWEELGRTLVAGGLGNCVLRIGREFNGFKEAWPPWQVSEGGQAAYIAGYRHVVDVLRAVPGAAFRFCWNPTIGNGNLTVHGTESCYPGDAHVDDIGLDVYDYTVDGIYPGDPSRVTTAQQQAVFDRMLTMWDGLWGWYSLARHHGKPLSFPEWGLVCWKTGGFYPGGGDNALFVRGVGDMIAGSGLGGWHAFWEDREMGVCDPDVPARAVAVPRARAAFLEQFGRG